MTQEEKELLLKDLCGRLPYGVICKVIKNDNPFIGDWKLNIDWLKDVTSVFYEIKPYLRPMSSMTNQEIETYRALIGSLLENSVTDNVATLYNFLNSKHLDYRGMIHMGLALEAPEGMYNINSK